MLYQSKQATVALKANALYLSGDLNVHNVMNIYINSLSYLRVQPNLQFDFSEVNSSDSAGLALMLEWMRYARKNNKTLQFKHISSAIRRCPNFFSTT